ncbi:facilitated trehalose transporter Tret1 [Manduca sexta]|uniref:facilitated trehalose transporter Tret1 n=1 Tax=Manduca sexta TaxID=7130 RepID=UPI0018905623|nr:facilitated trehalose transporter Tret1 [Manduca sexta]
MGKIAEEWVTPFTKQCFVTSGVSLNMAAAGLVMGFTTGLLEQLKASDSSIPIDDSSGSWIAAIPGFSLVVGNFLVPSIMSRYGRKMANLISIIPLIIGWVCIIFAQDVLTLMIARVFQGLCMGMATYLGSVLIGEYCSPKNRGAFLMTISISIAVSVLVVHTMGSYIRWQISALVCGLIALLDLFIVICSPESPSWLADQGRYDECRRVFRWLRGNHEEEELKRMIEASIIIRESKAEADISETFIKKLRSNIVYFKTTIQKKEFFKPIFIMIHIYTIAQWSGVNIVVTYAIDLFQRIVGPDCNIPLLVITLDAHRIIANIFAIYIIKKVKRRVMLFTTVGINLFALLGIAVYTYSKENSLLTIDHPMIGILLIHTLMFAVASGTLSLCFIIAGEIFPLEYRSLAGGISVLFYSANMFITVKTLPHLFNVLGVHGTCCINAAVVAYCLFVAWCYLPETKDRTLQDIEDEFRGRPLTVEELKSVQSLASWKAYNTDRRCSTPVVL